MINQFYQKLQACSWAHHLSFTGQQHGFTDILVSPALNLHLPVCTNMIISAGPFGRVFAALCSSVYEEFWLCIQACSVFGDRIIHRKGFKGQITVAWVNSKLPSWEFGPTVEMTHIVRCNNSLCHQKICRPASGLGLWGGTDLGFRR